MVQKISLIVYGCLLLFVTASASALQNGRLTVDGSFAIDAGSSQELTFSGYWPYFCAPILAGHELDLEKRKILIKLKITPSPCESSLADLRDWKYSLPLTQFPRGKYEVTAQVEPDNINLDKPANARTDFFSVLGNIAGQALVANPGVAGAEQFVTLTYFEGGCPSPQISQSLARSGNAFEFRINFEYPEGNVICPGPKPPQTPTSKFVSLGKLPAGGYDVTVTASKKIGASTTSNAVLQERLIVAASSSVETASLSGSWYNPSEPGSGMMITENNGTAFVAWFVYKDVIPDRPIAEGRFYGPQDGLPSWFTMTGKRDSAVIRGDVLMSRGGTDFRYNWNAAEYGFSKMGEAIITQRDSDNVSVTLAFGVRIITRNFTRLKF
jgi:hypothetical protein